MSNLCIFGYYQNLEVMFALEEKIRAKYCLLFWKLLRIKFEMIRNVMVLLGLKFLGIFCSKEFVPERA